MVHSLVDHSIGMTGWPSNQCQQEVLNNLMCHRVSYPNMYFTDFDKFSSPNPFHSCMLCSGDNTSLPSFYYLDRTSPSNLTVSSEFQSDGRYRKDWLICCKSSSSITIIDDYCILLIYVKCLLELRLFLKNSVVHAVYNPLPGSWFAVAYLESYEEPHGLSRKCRHVKHEFT